MKNVKAVIRERAKSMGLGPYDVAKLVKGRMTPQTVYNFIKRGAEMNSKSLGYLMEVLDLHIVGGEELAAGKHPLRKVVDTKRDTKTPRANVSRRKPT